jgi:hypothetical protein
MKINIFNVICLAQNPENDSWRLMAHCVAGTDSADAERRLKDSGSAQYLHGRMFIITDEYVEEYPQPVKMFYTGYTDEPKLSKHDAEQWIKRSTERQDFGDGELGPIPFREFTK